MRLRLAGAAAAVVVAIGSACGGGDGAADDDPAEVVDSTSAPTTEGAPSGSLATVAPESSGGATSLPSEAEPASTIEPPSTTEPPSATEPPSTTEPASELADALDLPVIELLTPASGGGDRPDLSWAPVDGADLYQVVLLAPDGAFYWGWTGNETTIPVGGLPRLVPEAAGPRLIPSMSWTVTAIDERSLPLAIGGPAEISP